MFRLALTNAPVRNTSIRRISSTVARWPAPPRGRSGVSLQWARIERRHNSSGVSSQDGSSAKLAKEGKPEAELSSNTAERMEEPAKPTFSSKDAKDDVSSALNDSKPKPTQASAESGQAAPSSNASETPKPSSTPSNTAGAKPTGGADTQPKISEQDASSSSAPPTSDLASSAQNSSEVPQSTIKVTKNSALHAEPLSSSPISDIPPVEAEELIEAIAVDTKEVTNGHEPIVKNIATSNSTQSSTDVKATKIDEMEEFDEDEDVDFENIDTSLEEATVKLFQSQEFAESLQSASEPTGPLETPDFGGIISTTSQPSTGRLRTREELGDNFTEAEWHSAIVHGRGVHLPFHHPRTHSIPAAVIHFRSHSPSQLALFTHFAQHAAASLGIPCSGVAALPTKRTLWTVIKGPFVHKKTQENFERRVHKRAIKAWDAHPDVVDLWASYLRKHAMGGVGMRVVKWSRAPVGVGEQMMHEAKKGWKLRKVGNSADKVKKLGEQIVDMEMRKDLPAVEANLPKP